eukprot:TRINITY_DN910_c1_g4_i1.p2 TRINITY_DN910_c1_g4~~TRINITY_DN910_c1_g4_i1.p2  ORF type:complete len:254 (-),score=105.26 TRINITY_DN910_c1_g4_i1:87-848(-)
MNNKIDELTLNSTLEKEKEKEKESEENEIQEKIEMITQVKSNLNTLRANILSTETITNKTGTYTSYKIQVLSNSRELIAVSRRYSDFRALRKQLQEFLPENVKKLKLPKKQVFGRMDSKFIEARRLQLEVWLQAVLEFQDQIFKDEKQSLLEFLGLVQIINIEPEKKKKEDKQSINQGELKQHSLPDLIQSKKAIVLKDFLARDEQELNLQIDDVIKVFDSNLGYGWSFGESKNLKGYFPLNFVKILEDINRE